MRVILVGRTGLDDILREDRSLELVRVRAPADAIGELATPVDDLSPGEAVVVVSGEAQRQLLARSSKLDGEAIPGRERMVEFIRGLRMVDPDVRVLGEGGTESSASDLFDATLPTTQDAEVIASALRERVAQRDATGAAALQDVPPDAPAEPTQAAYAETLASEMVSDLATTQAGSFESASAAPATSPDELSIIEQLLKGQDIVAPAMEVLRHRTGDPQLAFVPGVPGVPGLAGTNGVPVAWAGAAHGILVPGRREVDLAPHARWLAGWIRLRDQQAQLREAAFTDPLTGAWNRRYFDRFLPHALDRAKPSRASVTILLFDIDDFKRYNDEYGHEAGDEILVEVVRLMRTVTRPGDRICRIGGDEFAVVFDDPAGPRTEGSKHPASVSVIAQRFQKEILGHRFPKLLDCAPGTLTISGGLATFPWDGTSARELLAIADERAMESKRQGKNAITIGPGARLG